MIIVKDVGYVYLEPCIWLLCHHVYQPCSQATVTIVIKTETITFTVRNSTVVNRTTSYCYIPSPEFLSSTTTSRRCSARLQPLHYLFTVCMTAPPTWRLGIPGGEATELWTNDSPGRWYYSPLAVCRDLGQGSSSSKRRTRPCTPASITKALTMSPLITQ